MDTLTMALEAFSKAPCLGDRIASGCDVRHAWIDILKGEGLPTYKAKGMNAIELSDRLLGAKAYDEEWRRRYLAELHTEAAAIRRQELRGEIMRDAAEREMC